jgi:prepilin-type N-terminal cleavage/methylation domain-containing protein
MPADIIKYLRSLRLAETMTRPGSGNKGGFTLIELLVAMALLSMVTLVAAMALKIAIESWERGADEGESIQLWAAIPALMEKHLGSLVKNDPFTDATTRHLPFCGQEHALSFFTAYAPQGSPWQGLLRVTYLFNEEESTLYLFEQVITCKEDLNTEFDPLSDDWANSFTPISQVPGISEFNLTYQEQEKQGAQETDEWKDTWKCASTSLPKGLGISLKVGTDSKAQARKWYFRLGGVEP